MINSYNGVWGKRSTENEILWAEWSLIRNHFWTWNNFFRNEWISMVDIWWKLCQIEEILHGQFGIAAYIDKPLDIWWPENILLTWFLYLLLGCLIIPQGIDGFFVKACPGWIYNSNMRVPSISTTLEKINQSYFCSTFNISKSWGKKDNVSFFLS